MDMSTTKNLRTRKRSCGPTPEIDAPKVVKAFSGEVYSAWFAMVSGAAARVCWVADKTGMGHEGRLLIGHAQQVMSGFRGRPTDRSKASTRGCGSRFAGQAAPGGT